MLPSILHRVSQLLVAEDLRCIIAAETKLGLLSNDQWPPLVITDEEAEEPFEPEVEISATEAVDALQPELPLNGPEIDGLYLFLVPFGKQCCYMLFTTLNYVLSHLIHKYWFFLYSIKYRSESLSMAKGPRAIRFI